MKRNILIIAILSSFALVGCGHKTTKNSNANEGLDILSGKATTTAVVQPKAQPQAQAALPPLGVKTGTTGAVAPAEAPKAPVEASKSTTEHQVSKHIEKNEVHRKIEHFKKKTEVSHIAHQEIFHVSREQDLMNQCIQKEKQWAKYVCGDVVKREMEGN